VTLQDLRAPFAGLGDGVWIVGGCLRDVLLGRPVEDVDLAVSGDAAAIAHGLARSRGAGRFPLSAEFGAWRVHGGTLPYTVDITPLQGGDLAEDLSRRDFTVNAMALPVTGPPDLVDPHGGRADTADRTLRAVGPGAFTADPVRVLRAARIADRAGFTVEARAVALARAAAPSLWATSAERIRDEMFRIAGSSTAWRALGLLDALGGLGVLVPQLEAARGMQQNAYHHRDVLGHTLEVVEHSCRIAADPEPVFRGDAARLSTLLAEPLADGLTRGQGLVVAALLHDMAKPETREVQADGRVTFFHHDRIGAATADELLTRLRAANRVRAQVRALVRDHLRLGFMVHQQPVSVRQADRHLRATEPAATEQIVLSVADRLATDGPRTTPIQITRHLDLARQVLRIHLALLDRGPIRPPLPGDRIAAAVGVAPGPWLAEVIAELRERQLTRHVTPDAAVRFTREWLAGFGLAGPGGAGYRPPVPYRSRTAAMVALVLGAVAIVTPTASAQCGEPSPSAAQQVIKGIAAARESAGIPALRANPRLTRVANRHARKMALSGSIWHDNLAAWANGRAVAQNVAYGATGNEAFTAMWKSGSHRAAMMSRKYRLVGIGAARSCDGEIMVSVDLMAPAR
jgi:putative nucleotidyltransferase with HDIG domain